jgi:hypothetical protein
VEFVVLGGHDGTAAIGCDAAAGIKVRKWEKSAVGGGRKIFESKPRGSRNTNLGVQINQLLARKERQQPKDLYHLLEIQANTGE